MVDIPYNQKAYLIWQRSFLSDLVTLNPVLNSSTEIYVCLELQFQKFLSRFLRIAMTQDNEIN